MPLPAMFAEFISSKLIVSANASIKRADIRDVWTRSTHGSAGILKLYRHMETTGMTLTKTHLVGYTFAPVAAPIAAPIAAPVAAPIAIDPYKQMKIDLLNKQLEEAAKKRAEDLAIAEKHLEAENKKIDMMSKKMEIDEKIELEKLSIKRAEIKAKHESDMAKIKIMEQKRRDYVEQQEKNRAHSSIENNKNRLLSCFQNFNKNLDFSVYGNAGMKYITGESVKRTISAQMVAHTMIDTKHDSTLGKIINEKVNELVQELPVVSESGSSVDKELVEASSYMNIVSEVITTAEELKLIDEHTYEWKDTVEERVALVLDNGKRHTGDMTTLSYKDSMIAIQTSDAKPKDKKLYLKARNDAVYDKKANDLSVACYVCSAKTLLSDASVHRCHNVPKSAGGSWEQNNIYIACSNCNQSMGDASTIEEFVCTKYECRLDTISLEFTSKRVMEEANNVSVDTPEEDTI